jgi:hypothetical protein
MEIFYVEFTDEFKINILPKYLKKSNEYTKELIEDLIYALQSSTILMID